MKEVDGRTMPTERSPSSSTLRKRKVSPVVKRTHLHRKRQRLISSTETRFQISNRDQTLPSSSSIKHGKSSSSKQQREKKKKRRKSTISDSYRRWVFSSRDCSTYKDKVVVVSYNILGVENASKHPDLYFQVPPGLLNWDRRKRLIRKELNHYNPSIICFQEVDRFNDLADILREDGFIGAYKARTGEAYDGCAIFWKEELFTLLHQENIEFRNFGLRDNVAQLCVLKMNHNHSKSSNVGAKAQLPQSTPTRSILVGNIHVLFNPNRGDIKLGQIRLLLEKAHTISQERGSIPIVIAGDLNSMPQSAMYQFLASSELDILLHDRRKISRQVEYPLGCRAFRSQEDAGSIRMSMSRPLTFRWTEEEIQLATGNEGVTQLRHHLKLCSAYTGVPGSCSTRDYHGEPLATSYHSKFMGTVDYIWHSEELIPVGVVETLPVDILRRTGGLPSEKWGSDHLALVCELAFADDGNGID